jgi:hypothetical protein
MMSDEKIQCLHGIGLSHDCDECKDMHIEALQDLAVAKDAEIASLRAENEALRQMYCGDTDCNVRKEGNVDPAPLIDEAVRLRARVAELEAERDAARTEAAELRRLVKAFIDADEAAYNTDSTAPSFGDLITDMQNKYAALRAHITTTDKETPTQAAITAEGEG